MHAQVYQPAALITSQCCRRSREKLTLLCLAVKTLGFFLAQLVSSPNPGEPYPKSSASFLSSRRSSGLALYLLILAGPGLEVTSLQKPPDHLAPPKLHHTPPRLSARQLLAHYAFQLALRAHFCPVYNMFLEDREP